METSDLLKEPILSSTNGAHDSPKQVVGLELGEKVSDLKEPNIVSFKDSSPTLNKEFSPVPDRKESSPELLQTREDSPELVAFNLGNEPVSHFKNEEPIVNLSKDPSPLLQFSDVTEPSNEDKFLPVKPEQSLITEPAPSNQENDVAKAASSSKTQVFPTDDSKRAFEPETSNPLLFNKEEENFGFNKPLPPEPVESTQDFLKSESIFSIDDSELKPMSPQVIADDDSPSNADSSIAPRKSPSPPPVPKHQNLKEDSAERYEPSQTPEPDFAAFKPVSGIVNKSRTASETVPQSKPEPLETLKKEEPRNKIDTTLEKSSSPSKPTQLIGAQDIKNKIDAWFNPARLHPQVESLIYWRDPKKSGVVFGVAMISLLSLTYYSLISVVAYLCLLTLGGTITFRVYKNIMQAVQKTSDGHPFKDLLEVDLTVPEDKVSEVSQSLVQYLNTSLSTLRSLFLVEDLIDSIKFVVLLWVLTYVGALFNGLSLIIIGVILLFTLPKVYENNKAQIDVYVKMAMDKLSVITNRMKAAVPDSKKEAKPKDQ